MSYNPYQQESSGYHSAPGTPLEATFQSWDHQQMEDEARQAHNNNQGSAATSPTEYQHHHHHQQHQHGQQQHHVSGVATAPPTPTGYESHASHIVPSQLRRPPRESNRSREVRTSPTLIAELEPSIRPRVITSIAAGLTPGSSAGASSSSVTILPNSGSSGSLAVRQSHHGTRSRSGHALPYRRPQSALGGTQAMVAQAHMTHGTGSGVSGGGQTRIVRFASGDSTGVMYGGLAGTGTGDNNGLAALLSAGASPPLGGVISVTRSSSLPEAGPSSLHAPPPHSAPPLSDTHLNMIPQFSGSTSILSPSIVPPPPPPPPLTTHQEPSPQKYAIRGDVCYDPAIKQLTATLELPGVRRDRLSVSLGQCPYNGVRQITISGKAIAATPSGPQVFFPVRERRYGEYSRIFAVPSDTTADNIDAKFADGILTLTVNCPSAPDEVEEPASITIR